MKKSIKLFAGIALLVQAFTSVVFFFITLGKKKSLSGALLGLAAVTGAAGGYLVYDAKEQLKARDSETDCYDCPCTEDCDNCPCTDDCDNCPCNDAINDVDIDEKGLFSREEDSEEK